MTDTTSTFTDTVNIRDFTAAESRMRSLPSGSPSDKDRTQRSQRDVTRHRRCRRPARRADGADEGLRCRGFRVLQPYRSQKGRELAANPKAALLFHWKSLRRQVRIRGGVSPVTPAEADAYFATRPKQARSAPGRASSRNRWKAASPSSRRSPRLPQAHRLQDLPLTRLERLAHRAAAVRILARSSVPPARPHRIQPRGAGSSVSKVRLYP